MPSGLRCLIRSRYVVVTPDVRVLLRSWPLFFCRCAKAPSSSSQFNEHADLLLLGSNDENFVPDKFKSLSFVPAAFVRSPQAPWVVRRTGGSR